LTALASLNKCGEDERRETEDERISRLQNGTEEITLIRLGNIVENDLLGVQVSVTTLCWVCISMPARSLEIFYQDLRIEQLNQLQGSLTRSLIDP
jgi:hypothetical protein